jgi:hypothetical protein
MRVFLAIATYFGTLVLVSVIAFFAVLLLAGPHGGVLPRAYGGVVLFIGWIAVIALPFRAAWAAWRRPSLPPSGEREH